MIIINDEVIDTRALLHAFEGQSEVDNCGAVLAFSGVARADEVCGQKVLALELEHYSGMTEKALQVIVDQACARWDINACSVIHRVGRISVGEVIVFVLVASSHRKAAISAMDFIMDYLKNDVPIWKKEIYQNQSLWVEQKTGDKDAKKRW